MFGGIKTQVTVVLLLFPLVEALGVCGVDSRLHARSPGRLVNLAILFFATLHHGLSEVYQKKSLLHVRNALEGTP